jgi:alkylhydroperoxidase family enzyme
MARIDLPEGDELTSWLSLSPIGPGLGSFAEHVYTKSRLSRREFEAARYRIAESNRCVTCMNTRYEDGPSEGLDEDFYSGVMNWRTDPQFSERERLAIEFAERFAERWTDDDPDFWARLRSAYSDGEIVDLALQVAELVGAGRILHMLDIAQTCGLTIHTDHSMVTHPLVQAR